MSEKQFLPPTPEEIAEMQKKGEEMMSFDQRVISNERRDLLMAEQTLKDFENVKISRKKVDWSHAESNVYETTISGNLRGHRLVAKLETTDYEEDNPEEGQYREIEIVVDGIMLPEDDAKKLADRYGFKSIIKGRHKNEKKVELEKKKHFAEVDRIGKNEGWISNKQPDGLDEIRKDLGLA